MKKILAVLVLSASPAYAADLETRRMECMGWMMTGYPSGLEETSCTAQFALPSPFLFKCVRAQRIGFDSDTQKRACQMFFTEASYKTEQGYVRNN
mgnify:FL=1